MYSSFFFFQSQEEDEKVIYEALLLVDSRIYLEILACIPGAGFLTRAKSKTLRTRALNTGDFKIWDATTSRTRWLIKDWN